LPEPLFTPLWGIIHRIWQVLIEAKKMRENKMSINYKTKKNLFYNIIFLLFCGGVFLFLWQAPPESTSPLPHDDNHEKFFAMEKKEAEKHCDSCHQQNGEAPLPQDHPPKYRCLFCHKRLAP